MFKEFKTEHGDILVVNTTKNNIILELPKDIKCNGVIKFYFDNVMFKELYEYLYDNAISKWNDFKLKEVTSMANDYNEMYDKEFDSNADLFIHGRCITIHGPSYESNRLYKFTKSKLQTFLYDYKKILNSLIIKGEIN